tara:strand:+ start:7334 stop:8131 length:798 start_codon:yes stop_codon:yes gene_type:complete
MSIDWFTFTAQIFNFLVLVWLLSHFLYKPIVNAMHEREKQIAAEQEKAVMLQQQAEVETAKFKQKTEELVHAKEELLAEAGQEVQDWREEHFTRARAEIDEKKNEWYRALIRERHSFLREARLRMADHIHLMSRRVLTELANADLQQQTIEVFLNQIGQIDEQQKNKMVTLIESTQHRVLVESAFELKQMDQEKIVKFVHDFLGTAVEIDFQKKTELICGIELHVAGYKIAWNIHEPLEELEEEFVRSLNEVIALESDTNIPTTA